MLKVNIKKMMMTRLSSGYSITKLAESANMSKATIARIEKGLVNPNPATIGKIARALDVPIMDLFYEE